MGLKSLWTSFETKYITTEAALNNDRLHFRIMLGLCGNNEFNAIKYLYDRLNIIDAKAQGLLTRNGLLLTVVSIFGSLKLRDNTAHILTSPSSQLLFLAGFACLMFSTLATFFFITLKFDHITKIPEVLAKRPPPCPECASAQGAPTVCTRQGNCNLKTAEDIQSRIVHPRTLENYTETFFEITIKRQFWLRWVQRATFTASILYFSLIGYTFWQHMDKWH
jgi:hypothetical protein